MQPGLTISALSSGHFRDSSMSSLESWTTSSDGMDQANPVTHTTPTPQFLHILAANSPDIRDLCKTSSIPRHSRNDSLMSFTETYHHHQQEENPQQGNVPYWHPNTVAAPVVVPNTQPITSPDEQDRLVDTITRNMEKFQFYSPQRTPLQPSCDIKKPTRHRRVSYEMLPTMSEIAACSDCYPPAPVSNKGSPSLSRHRRNTTHLVLE